jgi:threonine dehydratase
VILFQDIEAARDRIAGAIYYSPCQHSIPLSEITGMEIFCKLDNLQRTGSFKEPGKIAGHSRDSGNAPVRASY